VFIQSAVTGSARSRHSAANRQRRRPPHGSYAATEKPRVAPRVVKNSSDAQIAFDAENQICSGIIHLGERIFLRVDHSQSVGRKAKASAVSHIRCGRVRSSGITVSFQNATEIDVRHALNHS